MTISIHDVAGGEITPESFSILIKKLELNYEKKCPRQKYVLLYEHIRREGWSLARFETAVHELLKNHRWATWTIADFYKNEQPVVMNHSEYLRLVNEFGGEINEQLTAYKSDTGVVIYFYKSIEWTPPSNFKKIF